VPIMCQGGTIGAEGQRTQVDVLDIQTEAAVDDNRYDSLGTRVDATGYHVDLRIRSVIVGTAVVIMHAVEVLSGQRTSVYAIQERIRIGVRVEWVCANGGYLLSVS